MRKLEFLLRLEGKEVSRTFEISNFSSEDVMVEVLAASIIKGFATNPEILSGMIMSLLDKAK